jgi:hypothetical protein
MVFTLRIKEWADYGRKDTSTEIVDGKHYEKILEYSEKLSVILK